MTRNPVPAPAEAPLSRHLVELRNRLLVVVAALLVTSGVAYAWIEPISTFLMAPLFSAYPLLDKLVYTNLTEAFISYIKVALLTGVAASFPVLLYQLWMYVAPGLRQREKQVAGRVVIFGVLLFGAGISFAYLVVLPRMLTFFMGFASDQLQPLPKLGGYLTFVARTALTFGIAFEIPFLMHMAGRSGLVSATYFARKRKYYYLVIVVLSFLLTAGDLLSCAMLMVPMILLYELGALTLVHGRTPGQRPDAAPESPADR